MDIDEAEGEDRGGDYGVEMLRGSAVEADHAINKSGQIFRPRADMVGKRRGY
jgi:hypothetical protein